MKSLIIAFLLLSIANLAEADPVIISGGPANDYESWIARLFDGRLMTVFSRNPDWVSGDLYVSFSQDDGFTWSEPQVIIQADGDQATLSFVQMPSGTLRLFYASNETGYYKIRWATSSDGLHWENEGPLDLGWVNTVNFYDPTVILEPDSSLTMSYVVMSDGVYVAHCPFGGTWDTEQTLVAPAAFRPRIMKHSDGHYLYAYHTRTGGNYEYDVFVKSSEDLLDWSEAIRITDNRNSHDPFVCQMSDGSYMIYYAKYAGAAYNICRRRSFDSQTWEQEEPITSDNTNNTQPHLLVEDNNLYTTWAHAVSFPNDHDVYFEKFDYATGIETEISRPHDFDMQLKSYPNPFNLSTGISFVLDKPRNVRLDIYDLLGRRVATLINANLWSGKHSLTWSADNLVAGAYFARLKAATAEDTFKLILVK